MGAYWDQVAQRPSLGQIFEAAGITKAQRDARAQDEATQQRQLEQQTYERDRQTRIDKMSLDQMNRQQQRQDKNDQAKLDAAKQTTDANKSRYAAQIVASDPSKAQTMAAWLRGQGIESEQANVSLPGGEQIQARATGDIAPSRDAGQFATDLEGQAAGVLGVQKPGESPANKITNDMVEYRSVSGLEPGAPGWGPGFERWQQQKRKAGATSVNVGKDGGIGLTQAQQGAVQGQVMTARKSLGKLAMVEDNIKAAGGFGEMASYVNRGELASKEFITKTPLSGMVDKQSRDKISKYNTASSSLATFRNYVTHELFGGALSPGEIQRIGDSVPDVGDPAAEEKMNVWRKNLEFEANYGADALLNGIRNGSIEAPESKTRVVPNAAADQSGGGAPRIVDAQSADRRAVELEQAGKQPQEVIQILRAEGLVQ